VAFLGVTQLSIAQKEAITLDDIYKEGTFRTNRLQSLRAMNNGEEYAVMNTDRRNNVTTVDIYDYETGAKTRTAVSTEDLSEIDNFVSYAFTEDETKILLATSLTPRFRRSTFGEWYVFDTLSRKLTKISDDLIQEPTLSPDGKRVAYGFENNIYIKNLETNTVNQVTTDGKKNEIINGITDWVYEEEFAFVRAFDWSADGKYVAYIRFDETEVPEFSMDVYGVDLYQYQDVFKYPKAGEKNAKVTLHVYEVASENLKAKRTHDVDLGEAYYIPRLQWTKDKNILSVQTLNRHQDVLKLQMYNAQTRSTTVALTDTDAAYVDVTDNLTFLDDNSFIWTSEKDGYNHIYHHNANGSLKNQVTSGLWEVTNYYGYDAKSDRVFYQSVENGSINRGVYSIKLNGKSKKGLATEAGTNSASFSADYSYFIKTYSSVDTAPQYTLHNAKTGNEIKVIKENSQLKATYESFKVSPKEFMELDVNGVKLNAWMIKPVDFDPAKKYPLFMSQYSGPGSQNVRNRWNGTNDYWYQMLAQEGIIIVEVDPRGTGFKGRDFKKITQKELGKYEVQDQIEAAKQLGAMPYIDADRIGIWGWSYGGFMASNCLFQGADTFDMAVAVAPVTSWRFYDTIYTERYMQTPQENPSGYDENSPISHVEKLKGDFLLVHGSADDNVHVQNTMRLIEALVQADKDFDWLIYPDKNHGIYGGNTRYHLFTKITDFIKEKL